jgi:hypothetical protein
MADISAYLDPVDDNGLRGYYIWHLFDQIRAIPPSEALDLIAQGCNFFRLANDLSGECEFHRHTVSI